MCGYQCDKAVNKNDTREVIWYHFTSEMISYHFICEMISLHLWNDIISLQRYDIISLVKSTSRKMRSTKGWEDGWLLLFYCIFPWCSPSISGGWAKRRKMKSLWKEMRNFDFEWSVNSNFITLKNEVNNMASPSP